MAFDPISAALDLGTALIDRLWPDPATRDKAKLDLLEMQQKGQLAQLSATTELAKAQIAVNQAEAQNPNVFISGGRPFLIWVCGASFAWVYCLQPIAEFVLAARGHPMTLPIPDMTQMMPVLLGLLGLGGMRTYEKMTGVNQKHG